MSANGIKQVKKRRTGKTGPPIFPVAAFLVVFVFLSLALTPSNVPKLLVELGVPQKLSDPNTFVWVIPQEGNYYCSGSVLAGRRPGKQMKQADALMFGYQPALGHYCGDGVSGKSNDQAGLMDDYETLRHGGEAIIARLMQISRSWVAGSYGRLVQSSSMLLFPSSRGFFRESPE